MLKKYTVLAALMMCVLTLVACSDGNTNEKSEQNNNQQSVEIDNEELVAEDDVVAVVNGSDILGETYNVIYTRMKMAATQMGEEVELDEMKKATLDSLIDRELVMQQAKEENIEVTDERVEEELSMIKETNGDGIETLLEQYQLSEDDFKEQLRFELTLDEYKEKLNDIEVTDKELKDYYDQAKKEDDDMPDLDEIKSEFKQQLRVQKINDALQEKIDKVREEADIDEKMEV